MPKEKVEISLELVKIDETLATNKEEKQLPDAQGTKSIFLLIILSLNREAKGGFSSLAIKRRRSIVRDRIDNEAKTTKSTGKLIFIRKKKKINFKKKDQKNLSASVKKADNPLVDAH